MSTRKIGKTRGVVDSLQRVYENSRILMEFSNFFEFFRIFSGSYGYSCRSFCIEFRSVREFFESTTPRENRNYLVFFKVKKVPLRKFPSTISSVGTIVYRLKFVNIYLFLLKSGRSFKIDLSTHAALFYNRLTCVVV